MAAWRSTTPLKTPRRRRLRVSTEKKLSTALSQLADVGVKWNVAGMPCEPLDHLGVLVGAGHVAPHVIKHCGNVFLRDAK
jgi:hypothetical protein